MDDRISRLESLLLCEPRCSPNVDEVLNEGNGGKDVAVPLKPGTEPDNELSPEKVFDSAIALHSCAYKAYSCMTCARTFSFDIFDGNSDMVSVADDASHAVDSERADDCDRDIFCLSTAE